MNKLWRDRQAQWERYRSWAIGHQHLPLKPPERLAEIGALMDLARQSAAGWVASGRATTASVQGIIGMRQSLSVLKRSP